MHRAASVVLLRAFFPLAVLVLEPSEEIDNRFPAAAVLASEQVLRPGPIFSLSLRTLARVPLVPACEHAANQFFEDVRDVERLGGRQVQAGAEGLLHLVEDPVVVREGPFVRRDGEEKRRVAELPLHIEQSVVPDLPIEWRELGAFEEYLRASTARKLASDML